MSSLREAAVGVRQVWSWGCSADSPAMAEAMRVLENALAAERPVTKEEEAMWQILNAGRDIVPPRTTKYEMARARRFDAALKDLERILFEKTGKET